MKKLVVLCLASMVMANASAEIAEPSPVKICSYLADIGLKGRKWVEDYGDGSSGCASDYKDIGSGAPLANNLAYYVSGAGKYVMEVKLVLNYNQPRKPDAGTTALVAASQKLAQRALGGTLPTSVIELIKKGEHGSENVGRGMVEVVREDWPNGKGYEVHVMMR
ncbi:hypothetical protein [Pseudomonas sp.]|uniref:hypothetical protein n=1 Tax=Pseudomonas sp. TaxID=306 RepID=UPI003D6E8E65